MKKISISIILMENLWGILARRIFKNNKQYRSKVVIIKAIEQECEFTYSRKLDQLNE
jgi:hypothetical protein